jgi:hypothetical protein
MQQYAFEKTTHSHSVWNSPSQELREHEKSLPAAPESLMGSSTVSGKIARSESRVSMMNLSESSGQAQARSSLLQLQRQHGNQFVRKMLHVARAAERERDVMPDVERAIESSRGGGQPLDSGVQAQMGQAFNADFSGVHIHTNAEADGLNQSLSARAFTTGQNIYFRQGEYNPGSSGGRELLAHELTHVVQQNRERVQTKSDDEGSQPGYACGASPAPGPQTKLSVSQPGDLYEQEADRMASAVMQRELKGSSASSPAESIYRQMPEEEEELQAKYRDDKIARQMEEEEEMPV